MRGIRRQLTILAVALPAYGCSGAAREDAEGNGVLAAGPKTDASAVAADELPAPLRQLVEQTVPGMRIAEVERKEREGRIYFDVEGVRPDGDEIELDVLQDGEKFQVVEVQRDIAWAEAPEAARAAAAGERGAFAPERVIESRQTDGSVIYELFAPGRKEEPAMEVRLAGGRAEVLRQRWQH